MSATQSERVFAPRDVPVAMRSALAVIFAASFLGCHETPTSPAERPLVTALRPAASITAGSFAQRPLGTLGGEGAYAVGINASGDIVGTSNDSTYEQKPTLWPAATGHLPQDLGSIWGEFVGAGAEAINTAGDIAGEADNGVGQGPTLWPAGGGAARNLGSLPGLECWVHGISDGGDVVGECNSSQGASSRATLWASGAPPRELASLGDQSVAQAINAGGTIVGVSYMGTSATLATIWPAGGGAPRDLGSLPDAPYCAAYGINDAGDVVGSCEGGVVGGAVLWKAGSPPRYIDTTGGIARAINNAGDVVGYTRSGARNRATLWPADGSGPVVLPLVLRQTESDAYGINSSRQIVGYSLTITRQYNAVYWELLPQQPQTITFTSSPPSAGIVGDTYTVTATGGGSGSPVTFSSLTPQVCAVNGVSVTLVSGGNCTVAADQAGNAQYLAAPQATQTFTVNTRPIANPGASQTGPEGSAITFDASGSSDPDGDALTNYAWDFGDGNTGSATTPTVQHVYADNNAGGAAYVATLTVTDAKGAKSLAASVAVLINNIAPTAAFAPPSSVAEGEFTLALTGVHDAPVDAASLQYSFDCGDGAGYRSSGGSPSFSCPAADNGVRSVRAEVRDKDGAANQYAATVTILNVAPTVTFVSAPSGKTATNYAIGFRFTDPGPADNPWRYELDWGDGRRAAAPTPVNSQGQLITESYRYNKPGTYTVTVRVTDKDGGSASSSVQVSIVK